MSYYIILAGSTPFKEELRNLSACLEILRHEDTHILCTRSRERSSKGKILIDDAAGHNEREFESMTFGHYSALEHR